MLPQLPLTLTLEQSFHFRQLEDESAFLSEQETKDHLLSVTKMLMLKDNMIKQLVKHQG